MEYAVETFSLTKIFSDWWGRSRVYAVQNLDLKIEKNEVFGLLGPNGSGKTTTLKMLLNLLHPTKGKAICLGGDSSSPKINERIGFLPEESYLYRYLNARETLDFYARIFALPSKVRKERIEALLDMVGLKAAANRPVGTYSKGMARRIGMAQALINDPELLILDEPTAGLDPIGTRQIKDLIIQLAKRGKTVLLSSHLLADVEDVCDRIAILYGGRIQAQGRVKDLLQKTDKIQLITGPVKPHTLENIKNLLRRENAELQVSSPMEKLENFFINTVTAAQKSGQTTSGVVSDISSRIGDFLKGPELEKASQKQVLEELVFPETTTEHTEEETTSTEKPVPVNTETQKPDDEILENLSRPEEKPPQPATKPVKTQDSQKTQKPDQDVLDQLTGKDKSEKQRNDQQTPPEKDSTNA